MDKKLHWLLGFILTIALFVMAYIIASWKEIDVWAFCNAISTSGMLILIFGKEIFDSFKGWISSVFKKLTDIDLGWQTTGFDWQDIKFGVGGMIIGLLASNISLFLVLLIGG
jgi:membrane-anchored protein YejM (alkaline phosphatase superfamily)